MRQELKKILDSINENYNFLIENSAPNYLGLYKQVLSEEDFNVIEEFFLSANFKEVRLSYIESLLEGIDYELEQGKKRLYINYKSPQIVLLNENSRDGVSESFKEINKNTLDKKYQYLSQALKNFILYFPLNINFNGDVDSLKHYVEKKFKNFLLKDMSFKLEDIDLENVSKNNKVKLLKNKNTERNNIMFEALNIMSKNDKSRFHQYDINISTVNIIEKIIEENGYQEVFSKIFGQESEYNNKVINGSPDLFDIFFSWIKDNTKNITEKEFKNLIQKHYREMMSTYSYGLIEGNLEIKKTSSVFKAKDITEVFKNIAENLYIKNNDFNFLCFLDKNENFNNRTNLNLRKEIKKVFLRKILTNKRSLNEVDYSDYVDINLTERKDYLIFKINEDFKYLLNIEDNLEKYKVLNDLLGKKLSNTDEYYTFRIKYSHTSKKEIDKKELSELIILGIEDILSECKNKGEDFISISRIFQREEKIDIQWKNYLRELEMLINLNDEKKPILKIKI